MQREWYESNFDYESWNIEIKEIQQNVTAKLSELLSRKEKISVLHSAIIQLTERKKELAENISKILTDEEVEVWLWQTEDRENPELYVKSGLELYTRQNRLMRETFPKLIAVIDSIIEEYNAKAASPLSDKSPQVLPIQQSHLQWILSVGGRRYEILSRILRRTSSNETITSVLLGKLASKFFIIKDGKDGKSINPVNFSSTINQGVKPDDKVVQSVLGYIHSNSNKINAFIDNELTPKITQISPKNPKKTRPNKNRTR